MHLWAVAALAAASCAVDSASTDVTPTTENSTTSSTARATSSSVPPSTTTSTTEQTGPVDISIDDEPLTTHDVDWDEGGSYVASRFFTPVVFDNPPPGWMSRGAGQRWVSLVWTSPDTGHEVAVNILAYETGLVRSGVADAILAIEGVDLVEDRVGTTVAGHEAITFDVFGQEKDSSLADYQCTTQGGRWNWDSSGYPLVLFTDETEEGWEYGIPACFRSRVWVIDSDAGPVTIVATPLDPDRFEELLSGVEPLLATMAFGTS